LVEEWQYISFDKAPVEIHDGDRGSNYPKSHEFANAGYCLFLNTGNVTSDGFRFDECSFISQKKDNELRKGKLQRNDVVLTTRGTVGNVAYFSKKIPYENMRINSGMVILRPETKSILPRYLYLFLRSKLFCEQVSSLTTGSAQPQLPIKDIKRIEIPIPPLDEQRVIARILGAFDDKIELNHKMTHNLETMSQAIFRSWFIDFEPVTAKRDGRKPVGMDDATAVLFPEHFIDTDMGPIPAGWRVGKVSELVNVTSGKRPGIRTAIKTTETPTPLFGGGGIMGYTDKPLYSTKLMLTGRVGTLGLIFRVIEPCWPSDNTLVISCDDYIYEYAYHVLSEIDFQSMNCGSTQPLVTQGDLKAQKIILPTEEIIERFHIVTSRLFAKIERNDKQNKVLANLRESLLPKLLTGELSVMKAEKLAEAVKTEAP